MRVEPRERPSVRPRAQSGRGRRGHRAPMRARGRAPPRAEGLAAAAVRFAGGHAASRVGPEVEPPGPEAPAGPRAGIGGGAAAAPRRAVRVAPTGSTVPDGEARGAPAAPRVGPPEGAVAAPRLEGTTAPAAQVRPRGWVEPPVAVRPPGAGGGAARVQRRAAARVPVQPPARSGDAALPGSAARLAPGRGGSPGVRGAVALAPAPPSGPVAGPGPAGLRAGRAPGSGCSGSRSRSRWHCPRRGGAPRDRRPPPPSRNGQRRPAWIGMDPKGRASPRGKGSRSLGASPPPRTHPRDPTAGPWGSVDARHAAPACDPENRPHTGKPGCPGTRRVSLHPLSTGGATRVSGGTPATVCSQCTLFPAAWMPWRV